MKGVRIAVAGAGLIGGRHIEEISKSADAELAAIVDPGPAGRALAERYSVPLYASLADLFAEDGPDGVILATPNQLHVDGGLQCVAAGVPVLVEKPIGDSVAAATCLVEAGEAAKVPVLTGHHRNYSPIIATAREIIGSGALGDLVGVVGTAMFGHQGVIVDSDDAAEDLPGQGLVVGAADLNGSPRARQRPPRQPDHALRRGDSR